MEQLVKVRKCNPDGTAQVLCIRESACSGDCHKCAGCGAVQQKLLFTAKNPIHAQPGDTVIVTADSGSVLQAAAVLYMLPLVLFFALWILFGGVAGGIGFGAGFLAAVVYDRRVAKKRPLTYTITGFEANCFHEGR